jgi:4-hydroxybenzoate polyprenyltransferase
VLQSLIRLARPGDWIKNSVVLAALFFAGVANDKTSVLLAFAAAGIFCLLSSAIYTINDIIDRELDKKHPLKKNRPIALGQISIGPATVFFLLLTVLGFSLAFLIGHNLVVISGLFFILNLLYTFWLKHIVILDVMTIAIGFVLRAYAGAAAIDVPASKWMLINTLFLALFLGFGKRRHELVSLEEKATDHRKILGKYSPYLLDQLIGVVTATVVVSYMLYTFSTEVSEKLGTEYLYFTVPFVVYGIFRYLYLIHKEDEGGSPTQVLASDKPLLINVILWLVTVIMILYWL